MYVHVNCTYICIMHILYAGLRIRVGLTRSGSALEKKRIRSPEGHNIWNRIRTNKKSAHNFPFSAFNDKDCLCCISIRENIDKKKLYKLCPVVKTEIEKWVEKICFNFYFGPILFRSYTYSSKPWVALGVITWLKKTLPPASCLMSVGRPGIQYNSRRVVLIAFPHLAIDSPGWLRV